MYRHISIRIAKRLFQANYIKNEDQEVYAYSIEIVLSSLVTLISIFLISIAFKCILPSLCFLVGFFSSRFFCGGFHAKHHITCYVFSIVNHLFFLLYNGLFYTSVHKSLFLFCILVPSLCLIFLLAPMGHPNNPMTQKKKQKFRKASRIYIVFLCVLSFFCYFSHCSLTLLSAFAFGVLSTSCALVIAAIEQKD